MSTNLSAIRERVREQLERSGHLSRSGAIRILVARGLEASGADEQRQAR